MSALRLKLFLNGSNLAGKVILMPRSYEELLKIASETFNKDLKIIYLKDGSIISSIDLLRDNDTIYASAEEPYYGSSKDTDTPVATVPIETRSNGTPSSSDWITLNVGGTRFTTTRNTLTQYPDTMLARMFNNKDQWQNVVDKDGSYLIDRSPIYFDPILNFLRHGILIMDDNVNLRGVLEEARFFGLKPIMDEIEANLKEKGTSQDVDVKNQTIEKETSCVTRSEFMRILMRTSSKDELRCQGVNLTGADLSYLDLRTINFQHANLSGANLQGASMSGCQLLLADLSGACLDDVNMEGIQMKRANLEGASMKNCKFETVSRTDMERANLEGANLKGANLEGSQMGGINLRLAMLKGANMQNCVLRDAILAGADLEEKCTSQDVNVENQNCNLTGADLQGANLRGANVVGTVFLDIVTPLHMVHLM